jgi:hypothetical protein
MVQSKFVHTTFDIYVLFRQVLLTYDICYEQELSTLPENLSSPPVFSGVPVTRCLVLYCYITSENYR